MAATTRPEPITTEELTAKLAHLSARLGAAGFGSVRLVAEGAMRWLTGRRHQVIDIAPGASTSVQATVTPAAGAPRIELTSNPWEKARALDVAAMPIWDEVGVQVSYSDSGKAPKGTLEPGAEEYDRFLRKLLLSLTGGFEGNQYRKAEWLAVQGRAALIEAVNGVEAGMDGWEVRNLVFETCHRFDLELNLVMVGLEGQAKHLHPIYDPGKRAARDTTMKLVTGTRCADMFFSHSQLFRLGSPQPAEEATARRALEEAALRYADLYRPGAVEGDIYRQVGPIFEEVAKKWELPGFETSAYLHHLGGPVSPLGNRDHLLTAGSTDTIRPLSQFAVNPVDALHYNKVEFQGVVSTDGAPLIFDETALVSDVDRYFTTYPLGEGKARLPKVVVKS